MSTEQLTKQRDDLLAALQDILSLPHNAEWVDNVKKGIGAGSAYGQRFVRALAAIEGVSAAAPGVPPPCDSTIHQAGAVVAVLEAGMLSMEGLVKEACRTVPGMDWHYVGGRAVVKTLGEVPPARSALERAMPRFLDA